MKLYEYEKRHLERLRSLLPECTVLLKSNGDFPLWKPCDIALYGPGARHTIKGGTGSGEVNSRFFVTVEEGLRSAGFTITSEGWLDAYDGIREKARQAFLKEIRARARRNHTLAVLEGMGSVMPEPESNIPLDARGDVALYVLSRTSGEGNDRTFTKGDLLLTDTEERDIKALTKKYKKFMLVLNTGGPVDLSPVLDCVENILLLSQLGVETGDVLADILLGKAYPSGRLTTTWAAAGNCPRIGEFGHPDDTRYKEGIYVGYRYYDTTRTKVLFPFGHGLGYTTFYFHIDKFYLRGKNVCVKIRVKNTGIRPGKEVVQLYVSVPSGELDQPYQVLAAFKKTAEIAPGGEEALSIKFHFTDLASFDPASASMILEEGKYVVHLGRSSRDTFPVGVIALDQTVTVAQLRHSLGTPDFKDYVPENPRRCEVPGSVPVLRFPAESIYTRYVEYDREETVDPFVDTLDDTGLAYVGMGAFNPFFSLLSVIGNASTTVAGAAGETTGRFKNNGMPPVIMSDGPAGLRLSKLYARSDSGVTSLGPTIPDTITEYLSPPLKKALSLLNRRPGKGALIKHQYATAIPVGTAIAQSWDLSLAYKCGEIVGTEMRLFGVHLWLAPALNIHRDIRCGRNYEYFSEDPVISGHFAAAITKGVQKRKKCGVTIKHFAANNQETNRYRSNSLVSERAMREIYLKGFGICVREASPKAVMTSYNLLNGVHTSERRDLINDILRSEFGFNGIVMTDWIVSATNNKKSKYPGTDAAGSAAAGCDLFMPGTRNDLNTVKNALLSGALSRKQLKINASRVYKMARKLNGIN